MALIKQDSRDSIGPDQEIDSPAPTITSSLLLNTFKSSRPIDNNATVGGAFMLLPREIFDEILSMVFAKVYHSGENVKQQVNELAILRTSPVLSTLLLSHIYMTALFKVDPWFDEDIPMPTLSQIQADSIQNIAFTISLPFAKKFRTYDAHGFTYEHYQNKEIPPTEPDAAGFIFGKFIGATTMRRSCSIEFHFRSFDDVPPCLNPAILGAFEEFTGFETLTVTVFWGKRYNFKQTGDTKVWDGEYGKRLKNVLRRIRARMGRLSGRVSSLFKLCLSRD